MTREQAEENFRQADLELEEARDLLKVALANYEERLQELRDWGGGA